MSVTVKCTYCGRDLKLEPKVAAASEHHFCSREHYGKWKTVAKHERRLDLFLLHLPDPLPIGDQCWEWEGSHNGVGYGVFGRPHVYAHRFAYERYVGPIPDGLFVCHRCDNPGCVRPSHLFVGTQKDNMADCSQKGRAITRPLPGEQNPFAKLRDQQVRDIHRRLTSGETVTSIARSFAVSVGTISHIKNGRSWAHITNLQRGI